MGRTTAIFLCILICSMQGVLAQAWQGFDTENLSKKRNITLPDPKDLLQKQNASGKQEENPKTSNQNEEVEASKKTYTNAFYYALGAIGLGIVIIFLFFYLFLRRPKNKWDHTKETKKEAGKQPAKRMLTPPAQSRPLRRPPQRRMMRRPLRK